jgi:hypothetical protein
MRDSEKLKNKAQQLLGVICVQVSNLFQQLITIMQFNNSISQLNSRMHLKQSYKTWLLFFWRFFFGAEKTFHYHEE